MTSDLQSMPQRTDRNAAISFVAGLLTLLAVCIAVVPVPLHGVCLLPGSGHCSAWPRLCSGLRALRRFKSLTASEKGMTVAGMAAGAAGVLITACSAAIAVVLGLRLVEAIRQLGP